MKWEQNIRKKRICKNLQKEKNYGKLYMIG